MSDVLQIAIGQGSACTPNCGAVMEGFTFSCSEFFASAFSRHSLTLTTLDAGRALEIVTAIKQEEWIFENHGILNCVSMITLNLRKPNTTALEKPNLKNDRTIVTSNYILVVVLVVIITITS
jgi:hypothetical protein